MNRESFLATPLTLALLLLLVWSGAGSQVAATSVANPRVAGVYYAAPAPTGSGDCSNWDNTCALSTALTLAGSGDEIWVQAGVHVPTSNPADRSASFGLKSGTAVYGGFGGAETARTQRDPQAYVTILSGDIDGNDVTANGIVTDTGNISGLNSYHVVTANNVDASAVLDGFVITAGQADGVLTDDACGGMYNTHASPTLTNLTFMGNLARVNGGGMCNYGSSNPALTHVIFSNNTSVTMNGGGMHNSNSNPALYDVTFADNVAYMYGGGMYNVNSSPELVNVIFERNTARSGGGMLNDYDSNPLLVNSIFSDNAASEAGGGMYNWNNCSPALINVSFSSNTAGYGGGLVISANTAPLLTNLIVWDNRATNAGHPGAQIFNPDGNPLISYSIIQDSGGSGGGWDYRLGTDGGHNLDGDPLFVNAPTNLRLLPGSPAINTGHNAAMPAGITADRDGNPRISGGWVDRGAYELQFGAADYVLTLVASGNGQGLVTSAPPGIACSDSCYAAYTYGTPVTLTAVADTHSVFTGWEGCGTANGAQCVVTMTAQRRVIVTFEYIPGTLCAAPIATGSGDCRSWADACTLPTALAQASSGDEIWVKAGVHVPTSNPIDRDASFALKSGVAVYGGFAGVETAREQRNPAIHLTILSGDIDNNDVTANGIVTDTARINGSNSYRVVRASNVDVTAVLDGFVITAGQGGYGAGMYNTHNSDLLIKNVTLIGNLAQLGGGMYNAASSPTLINVTFDSNRAADYGGGSGGGGLYNSDYSHPQLLNVIFRHNWAVNGGGMYNDTSNPHLINTVFISNTTGQSGAGMYNYYSNPRLVNVTVTGNAAYDLGGGIYNSAGIHNVNVGHPVLINTILWGNRSSAGDGAMWNPLYDQMFNSGRTPHISYSLIQGSGGSGAGWVDTLGMDDGNNLDGDPLFVDVVIGDLHLLAGSPAINAGSNAAVPPGVTIDLAGGARIVNGTVDVGAYEFDAYVPVSLIIPVEGGALTSLADRTTYAFPAGTFTDTVIITHTPRLSGIAPLPGNLVGLGHYFDITAVYSATAQPAQLAPGRSYTLTVQYTEAERHTSSEATLQLYGWSGAHWTAQGITSTVYGSTNSIVARVNHFSLFAVLGETHRIYLPLVLRAMP